MRLAEIKSVIATGVDVDAAWSAYQGTTGRGDSEGFLDYLKEHDLVSQAAVDELLTTELVSALPTVAGASAGDAPERDASDPVRYELLGMIGRGGMGVVWAARDLELQRTVALKTLGPEMARDAEAAERFVREARITAQLDHPYVVPVHAMETGGAAKAYAMKLVKGKTFARLIAETRNAVQAGGPLDEEHALAGRLERFVKVCDAMAFAHARGVLHRDLKPENLMLGPFGEVFVMDWGLARVMGGAAGRASAGGEAAPAGAGASQTRLGEVMGTPRYMSPEQAAGGGETLDGRSDQYALGLILQELVTLGPAIKGDTVPEVLESARVGRRAPMVPSLPGADVPRPLAAVVAKATAPDRRERYAGVDELAADVRRFLRDEEILAKPDNALQRLGRRVARHRQATLVSVAGLFALVVIGTVLGLWRREIEREEERLRSERLQRFAAEVGRNASGIAARLQGVEGLLRGLAVAAEEALAWGTPSEEAFATADDFREAARRPADTFFSHRYGGWVSGESPVWMLPPGTGALDDVRRLVPLRRTRRDLFVVTQEVPAAERGVVSWRDLLEGEHGVLWSVLALASGPYSVHPGSDCLPEGWDPTASPWFQLALSGGGVTVWEGPLEDPFGTGPAITCSLPLRGAAGEPVGVAAVLLSLDRVARTLVDLPGDVDDECFLLDDSANVLVRAKEGAWETATPFPWSGAVEAMRRSPQGTLSVSRGGRDLLLVWWHLEELGLIYAVAADHATAGAAELPPFRRS